MKKLLAVLLIAALVCAAGFAQAKVKVGVTMPTATHGWMGGANWWAKKSIDDWKSW